MIYFCGGANTHTPHSIRAPQCPLVLAVCWARLLPQGRCMSAYTHTHTPSPRAGRKKWVSRCYTHVAQAQLLIVTPAPSIPPATLPRIVQCFLCPPSFSILTPSPTLTQVHHSHPAEACSATSLQSILCIGHQNRRLCLCPLSTQTPPWLPVAPRVKFEIPHFPIQDPSDLAPAIFSTSKSSHGSFHAK